MSLAPAAAVVFVQSAAKMCEWMLPDGTGCIRCGGALPLLLIVQKPF